MYDACVCVGRCCTHARVSKEAYMLMSFPSSSDKASSLLKSDSCLDMSPDLSCNYMSQRNQVRLHIIRVSLKGKSFVMVLTNFPKWPAE